MAFDTRPSLLSLAELSLDAAKRSQRWQGGCTREPVLPLGIARLLNKRILYLTVRPGVGLDGLDTGIVMTGSYSLLDVDLDLQEEPCRRGVSLLTAHP